MSWDVALETIVIPESGRGGSAVSHVIIPFDTKAIADSFCKTCYSKTQEDFAYVLRQATKLYE